MNTAQIFGLALKLAPYILRQNPQQSQHPMTTLTGKDVALINLRNKDGAVIVILGTRGTGKSQLAYRLAEFLDKPIYAISPEQNPPPFIKRIKLQEIDELVPSDSTIIADDLPAYASNRDYNETLVRQLERLIPMCRHEKKLHLIFCSQSAAQADKYILDCDMAFLKPLGLLYDDLERANIRRIYRNYVDPVFDGKSEDFIVRHAYMLSRSYRGIIEIKMVD